MSMLSMHIYTYLHISYGCRYRYVDMCPIGIDIDICRCMHMHTCECVHVQMFLCMHVVGVGRGGIRGIGGHGAWRSY